MKKIKKLLCMMLAVLMLAFSCAAVSAEEPTQPDMEELHQKFIAYLDEQGVEHEFGGVDSSNITFITNTNNWTIFYGTPGWAGNMVTNDRFGKYIFVSQFSEVPYEIGLYAEKKGKVFTLKEAYDTGTIDITKVVDNIGVTYKNVYLAGDTNMDGGITASDALEVQKAIAKYIGVSQEEFSFPFYDYDGNGVIEIKDVLDMQKKIAKVAM